MAAYLKRAPFVKLAAFFKGDPVATVKRDKTKAVALQKTLGNLDGAGVRVGFFEGSKYDDGTPVALVAATQEFGSPKQGIPPRPFMRQAIAQKSRWWARLVETGMNNAAAGKMTAAQVWDQVGMKAAGDVRKAISEVQKPPLKQATVNARLAKMADGKTVGNLRKPLVETGVMFNAVTHELQQ